MNEPTLGQLARALADLAKQGIYPDHLARFAAALDCFDDEEGLTPTEVVEQTLEAELDDPRDGIRHEWGQMLELVKAIEAAGGPAALE